MGAMGAGCIVETPELSEELNGSTAEALINNQQAKLTPSDGQASDQFGDVVALDGDTAVIGAPTEGTPSTGWPDPGQTNVGAVYVFTRTNGVWSQQQKLVASDRAEYDYFGTAVAVSGNTVLVGAKGADNGTTNSDRGAVYVFTRSGSTWTQQQKLTASDAANFDQFGTSLAIDGTTAVVGVPLDDHPVGIDQAGSAYVFTCTNGVWSEQQKLTASDKAYDDRFGIKVAVSGDSVLVGAYGNDQAASGAGAAYVFTRTNGVWSQQQKLTASDAAVSDAFGQSVSLDGDTAVVGAPNDDTLKGSVYVFTRTSGVWSQQQKLTASDRANYDYFGSSCVVKGDTVAVGATSGDIAGANEGSVYLFSRSGTTWTQDAEIGASDAAQYDRFGSSVALSGTTLLVGASLDDVTVGGSSISNMGSAYVFVEP